MVRRRIDPSKDDGKPYTQEYIDAGMPGWPSRTAIIGAKIKAVREPASVDPQFVSGGSQDPRRQIRYSKNPSRRSAPRKRRTELPPV